MKTGIKINGLKLKGKEVTASADELNRGALKKATGDLAAVDTAGGVFAWQNPEASDILVEHVALKVTTKTTDACTVDVGTTAVSAATSSDTFIDGQDVGAATGTFGSINKSQRLASGKWVTASKASGASAGLKGSYEIYYRVL